MFVFRLFSESVETLFGKNSPSKRDTQRKGISVLMSEETNRWLKEKSHLLGVTYGSFLGILLEHVRGNPEDLAKILAGKYAEDLRGGKRDLLRPATAKSDPEALAALLALPEKYEYRKEIRREDFLRSPELAEAVRRLENPGDFLDHDAEEAVAALLEAFPEIAPTSVELADARTERHRISASWGDIAAWDLIQQYRHEHLAETLITARDVRHHRREAEKLAVKHKLFVARVRAWERGSNIPQTLEQAQRMTERRDGRAPLVVLDGRKAC